MDYTEVIEEERQPQDQLLSQAQDKRAGKELIFTKFFVVGIVDKSGSRGSRGQLPSSSPPLSSYHVLMEDSIIPL